MTRPQRIAVVVTLVLTGAGVYGVYRVVTRYYDFGAASSELSDAVAAYRRDGLPFVAADLFPRPVPTAENAAPAIQAAAKLVPKESADAKVIALLKKPGPEADALLQSVYAKPLAFLEAARDRPRVDFKRDWDLGPYILFPEYRPLKALARAASLRAVRAASKGDDAAALRDLALGQRIALWAEGEPTLISMLVRIASEAIVLDGAERCLVQAAKNPARIGLYRRWLTEAPPAPSFDYALRGEAWMGVVINRNLDRFGGIGTLSSLSANDGKEGEPQIDPAQLVRTGLPEGIHAQGFMTRHLQVWDEAYRTTDGFRQPAERIGQRLDAIARRLEGEKGLSYVLERILLPVFSQAGQAVTGLKARRAVRLALADALEIHARTGRWPSKVAGIDPFTGQALKVRADAKGFRVWSVGKDRKDDGGRLRREMPKGKDPTFDDVAAYPPIL